MIASRMAMPPVLSASLSLLKKSTTKKRRTRVRPMRIFSIFYAPGSIAGWGSLFAYPPASERNPLFIVG
jgi:hypothetical protein